MESANHWVEFDLQLEIRHRSQDGDGHDDFIRQSDCVENDLFAVSRITNLLGIRLGDRGIGSEVCKLRL
jgi:hypothetical protein